MKINKAEMLQQIVVRLQESLSVLEKAARASHEEATHESSRAESKYDTRGLEAAYLAGGQARQAREILDAIKLYAELAPRNFGKSDAIDVGALVKVEFDGVRSSYFIGPKSGGLEIVCQGEEIIVITPHSPLGQNLMGRKAGEKWSVKAGASPAKYQIISVA